MKKKSTLLATLALAGIMAVGAGTYALMSDKTDSKTNVFTVGSALTGELKEPLWDGQNFTKTDLRVTVPTDDTELGMNLATNFVAKREIPKDPAVANTSTGTNAWIAVTIEYTGDANSAAAIDAFADIDWNTTNWTFNDDYTVAYYKNPVVAGNKTNTLFDKVVIDADANANTPADEKTMRNFDIKLTAYLVQEEGNSTAQTAMIEAFPDVFGA